MTLDRIARCTAAVGGGSLTNKQRKAIPVLIGSAKRYAENTPALNNQVAATALWTSASRGKHLSRHRQALYAKMKADYTVGMGPIAAALVWWAIRTIAWKLVVWLYDEWATNPSERVYYCTSKAQT